MSLIWQIAVFLRLALDIAVFLSKQNFSTLIYLLLENAGLNENPKWFAH